MPIKEQLDKNENYYKAWLLYTKEGILDRELLRPVVADSWERSHSFQVNHLKQERKVNLSKKDLNNRYKEFMPLLKTAKPFMDSLYKMVGGYGLLVRLTDKDGYILECIGNADSIDKIKNLNVQRGCNVREEIIGTNAIGTALFNEEPIQIFGSEHYCKEYHSLSSSACPIKNDLGQIIGILSMTGDYKKFHPHTLGMIVAAAEAIENELKLELINKQLKLKNKHFHAIMESISEGLICINEEGIVTDINFFARQILGFKLEDILGKRINSFLCKINRDKVLKVIKNGKKYEEEELYFKNKNGNKIACIATVTPIYDGRKKILEGVVITFKEAKVVHSLVNKIVGSQAKFEFDDILGEDFGLKEAVKIAKKSSKHNTTLLLQGESGTGKELFAHSIHNAGYRRNKPFIFLNCGAIPRDLVASELFGYVEGAFTGAKRGGHPGKFELADGGTIFLDEIGDMPLDTQANLLRVIETKEVVRVGGHDVIPVDVRVIAATHKDLEREVRLGSFRQDLYYRLNVVSIKIPPLRNRKEDIKIFIDYFFEKFSIKMKKRIMGVSSSFYKGMMEYDWPGNVRELQNVMQHIINIVDNDETITAKYLPNYIKRNNTSKAVDTTNDFLSLEEIEKRAIEKTIDKAEGNIALASRILGIGRSSLYRKMNKYNIRNVSK